MRDMWMSTSFSAAFNSAVKEMECTFDCALELEWL